MTLPGSNLESEQLPDTARAESIDIAKIAGQSPARLAINRFRKDKLSMVAFVVVAVYVLCAIAAPFLVKFGVLDPYTLHNVGDDNLLDVDTLPKGALGGISGDHPLGVEPGTGRDVLARMWYGITFSLAIAISATIISVVVGTVLGIIAGFSGGWVDAIVGRIIDLTLSFPVTLMLLALSGPMVLALQNAGVPKGDVANGLYVVLVLGIFGWPSIARIVRGQVFSIREREFVDAARLLGASRRRLYFKEVLPNLWAPLLVQFTLVMPLYISAEAALNFLGVGIKPPTPTLGNLLSDAIVYATTDAVFFFAPAVLIMIIVVSFNLLGDGIRDALDPKSSR
jgi:peptide/nickel transport system permease protein